MTNLKLPRSILLPIFFLLFSCSVRSFAQTLSDSVAPSNEISAGHSYFGVDLGITGTTYLGNHNFLWPLNPTDPTLRTYVPFNNLGFGVGFMSGLKLGLSLSSKTDFELKTRFFTNHTSNHELTDNIILDPYKPSITANSTNDYSLTMYNVGVAMLAHYRLSDIYYAVAGVEGSAHTGNSVSYSQQLSGGNSYLRTDTHTQSFIYNLDQPSTQLVNFFNGVRGDLLVGAGSTHRFGADNMIFDAELLVSIPFTVWVQKTGQNLFALTSSYYGLPAIAYPHQWYASLTIGVRMPFHQLPPPIVPPPPPPQKTDSALHVTIQAKEDTATGRVELTGRVTDAQSGKPIKADLTTVDLGNNKVVSTIHADSNGIYHVFVNKPGKYSVTAEADGYLFGSAYFEVDSNGRILKSEPDIKLSPVSNGRTRLLVFFEFDKADLQQSSSPELNRAVELMKAIPTLRVEIAGYTDSIGTKAHNMDLSLRRANAVRDFLIQHGVSGARVTAKGYGTDSPIATNETEEGRAANRRVEFVVVSR